MKKPAFYISLIFIILLFYSLPVKAQTKGAACDPRKIDECCKKFQKVISELDALKAKLHKMHETLQKGEVTGRQADSTFRYFENIESFLKSDEVQDFGLGE